MLGSIMCRLAIDVEAEKPLIFVLFIILCDNQYILLRYQVIDHLRDLATCLLRPFQIRSGGTLLQLNLLNKLVHNLRLLNRLKPRRLLILFHSVSNRNSKFLILLVGNLDLFVLWLLRLRWHLLLRSLHL